MGVQRARRRFDLVDGIVLIVATAFGLFLARDLHGQYTSTMFDMGRHNPHGFRLWNYVAVPLFASWSLALIPLRFRRPRPRRKLLVRRPGFVVYLAVGFMALRALIEQEGGAILHGYPWGVFSHWDGPWSILAGLSSRFVYLHHATGWLVAAPWVVLGVGRCWRPEPSWVDRAGRALGCYWIATFLISCYQRLAS